VLANPDLGSAEKSHPEASRGKSCLGEDRSLSRPTTFLSVLLKDFPGV
jgi:hypothetical protein